jgi:ATP-dependent Lon protease
MTLNTRPKRNVKPTISKDSKKVLITLSQKEKEFIDSLGEVEVKKIVEIFKKNTDEPKPIRMSVLTSSLPDEIKLRYFNTIPYNDSDKYLSLVRSSMEIPFSKSITHSTKNFKKFLDNANKIMDKHITGNYESKREVLKLLCKWKNDSDSNTYAIGLEGSPGTGKTTFVKRAFSEATTLPLVYIGLGGCQDSSFLLGSSYTYEGSTYGRLVGGLIETKCCNPIFFFDELDKVSSSPKGSEIINVLIHLIDISQNSHIRDKYFNFDIDFSKCIFVFSYNDPEKISPVLLDRIKRIRVETPNNEEKLDIMIKNIIPKYMGNNNFSFEEEALKFILKKNQEQTGLRSIEKDIEHVTSCFHLYKTYGSASILGLEEMHNSKKVITFEFVKKLLKSNNEYTNHTNMMYM